MGGWDGMNRRNEVLQLYCLGEHRNTIYLDILGEQIQSCVWKEVGNLQYARLMHVSIPVPESFANCDAGSSSSVGSGTVLMELENLLTMVQGFGNQSTQVDQPSK